MLYLLLACAVYSVLCMDRKYMHSVGKWEFQKKGLCFVLADIRGKMMILDVFRIYSSFLFPPQEMPIRERFPCHDPERTGQRAGNGMGGGRT